MNNLFRYILWALCVSVATHCQAQEDCSVHTDTLYYVTIMEQETVLSPEKVILEPNVGQIWVRDLSDFSLDTTSYNLFLESFYRQGVYANSLLSDYLSSMRSKCNCDLTAKQKERLFLDNLEKERLIDSLYENQVISLVFPQSSFFSYDSGDTIVADVSVDILIDKLVCDYHIVPFDTNSFSTTYLPYSRKSYPFDYCYQLFRIREVLPIEPFDTIKFSSTVFPR